MRAIWKGAISFGLVNIPVSLFPALRREDLKFRLLRGSDMSPVNYKRVAEADGKEVPWEQIVKGYEYEKGQFVVLKDEDFARVDIEATQTVDIVNFVELAEVNPLLFNKPYYMQPARGGEKAYALLREALVDTGKIGIAQVVIKTRQHLAAIKPQEPGLMLELMHYPETLIDVEELADPKVKKAPDPRAEEMAMAKKLIASMTTDWRPENYRDDYREKLEKIVEEKIEHAGEEPPPSAPKRRRADDKVIDLVEVLRQSLAESGGKSGNGTTGKKSAAAGATAGKKPANAPAAKTKARAKTPAASRRKAA